MVGLQERLLPTCSFVLSFAAPDTFRLTRPLSLLSRSLARFHPPSVPPRPVVLAASPRAKISVVCAVSSDSIGHPESVVRRQRPATTPASSKSPLRHSFPIEVSWANFGAWNRRGFGFESVCFNEILNPIAGLNNSSLVWRDSKSPSNNKCQLMHIADIRFCSFPRRFAVTQRLDL